MKQKNGVSLIVLIIIILVVIILAAVVILSFSRNNPIESAKEAVFKEDIKNIQDEISMYVTKEYKKSPNDFDILTVKFTGKELVDKFKIPTKYENKISVKNGKVVYIGQNENEKNGLKKLTQ